MACLNIWFSASSSLRSDGSQPERSAIQCEPIIEIALIDKKDQHHGVIGAGCASPNDCLPEGNAGEVALHGDANVFLENVDSHCHPPLDFMSPSVTPLESSAGPNKILSKVVLNFLNQADQAGLLRNLDQEAFIKAIGIRASAVSCAGAFAAVLVIRQVDRQRFKRACTGILVPTLFTERAVSEQA
jgi:hypothetical protein